MTQVARPAADVSNSGWSPTPLYAHINTASPNDGAPISCALPPGGSFEVALAPAARPITGTHTLTVRFQKTDPTVSLLTFSLLQGPEPGASVIAARSVLPTQAFTDYALALTEQEVDLIADYSKLLLRVLAGGAGGSPGSGSGGASGASGLSGGGAALIQTTCCANPIPAKLNATVSSAACSCAPCSIPVAYDAAAGAWVGTAALGTCGHNVTIALLCVSGQWHCLFAFPDGCGETAPGSFDVLHSTCTPLNLVFTGIFLSSACGCTPSGGNVNVTFTPA
jgi:hypothetical protein